MNTITQSFPPLLTKLFDRIFVAQDLLSARVDDRDVEADSPFGLKKELSKAIYEVLHAGISAEEPDLPYHGRDDDFERLLTGAVPHDWTDARIRLLTLEGETAVVLRDGLRVRVPLDSIQENPPFKEGDEVTVRVRSFRPRLSPGFFFLNGTRGSQPTTSLLRMYVHLRDSEGALAVWGRLTPFLEGSGAHYRTKILSMPLLYPRRDAMVVYLSEDSAKHVAGITAQLAGAPELGESTPAFAERVAPGVSIAWEPADPRKELQGLSFGQHRAHLMADSLFESADKGIPLEKAAEYKFTEANVDLGNPSRNIDSPLR